MNSWLYLPRAWKDLKTRANERWPQMMEGVAHAGVRKQPVVASQAVRVLAHICLTREGEKEVTEDICWHAWDLQSSTFHRFCRLAFWLCQRFILGFFFFISPRQDKRPVYFCAPWSSDERAVSVGWHDLHQERLLMHFLFFLVNSVLKQYWSLSCFVNAE